MPTNLLQRPIKKYPRNKRIQNGAFLAAITALGVVTYMVYGQNDEKAHDTAPGNHITKATVKCLFQMVGGDLTQGLQLLTTSDNGETHFRGRLTDGSAATMMYNPSSYIDYELHKYRMAGVGFDKFPGQSFADQRPPEHIATFYYDGGVFGTELIDTKDSYFAIFTARSEFPFKSPPDVIVNVTNTKMGEHSKFEGDSHINGPKEFDATRQNAINLNIVSRNCMKYSGPLPLSAVIPQ